MFVVGKTTLVFGVFCAVSVCSVAGVFAAPADLQSVKERGSPYYSPVGGRFGAFKLLPSLDVGLRADDNIYRQSDNQKSDAVTLFKPALEVSTDWSLHEVKFGTDAEIGKYWKHRAENFQDFSVYLSGVYDVTYGTKLFARVAYDKKHEERGSPEDVNGDQPTEYSVTSADFSFVRDLSILKLMLRSYWVGYDYDNGSTRNVIIDNGEKDRTQSLNEVRLGYELSDRSQIYVSGRYDRRRYALSSVSARNSDGTGFRVGFLSELSGKMKLDLYGGYMNTSYESGFSDVSGVDFGGKFLWNITGITSLKAQAERSVAETTVTGASGIIRTVASFGLEHAFRENIIADLSFEMTDSQYQGAETRDNVIYTSSLGVDYLFTPNWRARAAYEHLYRDFAESGDYTDNRMMMWLRYVY